MQLVQRHIKDSNMDMKQVVAGAQGQPAAGQSISVMIEVESDGSVTVGTPPEEGAAGGMMATPGGEEATDKSFMKPAKSIDDALQIARDLLTNPQAVQAAKQQGFESVDQGGGMGG